VSERSEVTPAAARRGVALTPMEVRRDVIVRAARLADDLGYEVFSVAEGWGLDATVVLAEIAARTTRITRVAGILSAWGRSPATIAMSAATLHDLSGGRFVHSLVREAVCVLVELPAHVFEGHVAYLTGEGARLFMQRLQAWALDPVLAPHLLHEQLRVCADV